MTDDTGKRCTKCGEQKPLSDFSPRPDRPCGYQSRCKACNAADTRTRMAAWEEANPERYREGRRKKQKRFWDTHPEYRQRQKMRWTHLKEAVFDHYGRVCACCGAKENLSIDHPDGDGAAHRVELFGSRNATGQRTYQWLVDQGFPVGFQVLCMRCNRSKGDGSACKLHNPEPHCPSCSCYP